MAAYEMKKCPFCGGGTTQLMEKKNHAEIIYQFVYCLGCFAEGPGVERTTDDDADTRKAIALWNYRPEFEK